jgi:hypothetical protein
MLNILCLVHPVQKLTQKERKTLEQLLPAVQQVSKPLLIIISTFVFSNYFHSFIIISATNSISEFLGIHGVFPHKANRIFVTLQTVLLESMKIKGSNNYKIPHMNKDTLERQDMLSISIPRPQSVLQEADEALAD